MKEEVFFKINVEDISKRKRIIKENLRGRLSHKGPFKIKGKFKNCPVVNLDINIPIYHLNNGRTRELQTTHIVQKNRKENFFEQGQENNNQQKIQHEILFKLSQDSKANIYKELKITNSFREDSPLLIDINGMLINGNRRLSAIRELYKSDEKKYKDFRTVPCAVIEEHLNDIDIKEIENFLQVKQEHKAEYSWISLCLEVKNEKKRLKRTNKEIATDMGKTESEIERLYNLTNVIDKCLEEDHKSKGNYDLIKDQQQIWKNTEERASKKGTTKGERDLIYKIARMVSVNSGKFGNRDYGVVTSLQKKNNLNQVMQFFKEKYKSIKPSTTIRDTNDPLRGLDRVNPKAQIYPLEVDQIPVKTGDKQIQILLEAEETLLQSGDDNASVKYSRDALKKIISMNSMRFPDQFKREIRQNLNELVRKCTRLIKDKKL
jgi:hypothetical protein